MSTLQPKSKFVANFIGSTNQLTGQVTKLEVDGTGDGSHRTTARFPAMLLDGLTAGSNVVVVVRPESINVHLQKPPMRQILSKARSAPRCFWANIVDCTIELGKNILQTHQRYTLQVRRGDPVWVELPAGECMALPAEQ